MLVVGKEVVFAAFFFFFFLFFSGNCMLDVFHP